MHLTAAGTQESFPCILLLPANIAYKIQVHKLGNVEAGGCKRPELSGRMELRLPLSAPGSGDAKCVPTRMCQMSAHAHFPFPWPQRASLPIRLSTQFFQREHLSPSSRSPFNVTSPWKLRFRLAPFLSSRSVPFSPLLPPSQRSSISTL